MALYPQNLVWAHPYVLLLLAPLALGVLLRSRRRSAPAVMFSSLEGLRGLGRSRRSGHGGFWLGLLLLGIASLVLALARPQLASVTSKINPSGIDILIALDVSRSMLAEDIHIGRDQANRLEAVKKVTEDFVTARPADRIGMLAFAGQPYLVSPLTLNHDWLLQNLARVRIGLVEDGTAIGSALASAANRLKERKESKSKIILLLTDGENNAGRIAPNTAAEAAHTLGIRIYTVGVGSRGFAPVPQTDASGRPMTDMFGRPAYTQIPVQMDEPALRKLAEIGDGKFFRATDSSTLKQVFEQIDQLEKTAVELSETRHYQDLFHWFVAAGVALIALHAIAVYAVQRRLP
jgi:Ca-activated chloride channel family protein